MHSSANPYNIKAHQKRTTFAHKHQNKAQSLMQKNKSQPHPLTTYHSNTKNNKPASPITGKSGLMQKIYKSCLMLSFCVE